MKSNTDNKLSKVSAELTKNKVGHTVKGGRIIVKGADNSDKLKSMEDKAKAEMEKALKLMEAALVQINSAKTTFTDVAKKVKNWDYPIADLGYYSKQLFDLVGAGGIGGFSKLVRLQSKK